jgi:hypothetical protein
MCYLDIKIILEVLISTNPKSFAGFVQLCSDSQCCRDFA